MLARLLGGGTDVVGRRAPSSSRTRSPTSPPTRSPRALPVLPHPEVHDYWCARRPTTNAGWPACAGSRPVLDDALGRTVTPMSDSTPTAPRRSRTCSPSAVRRSLRRPHLAVSPDGQRIAFVVATIDLGENTTRAACGSAGRTATRLRSPPAPTTATRCGRPTAAFSPSPRARREGEGGHAARDADRRPWRGAHAGHDARGLRRRDVVTRRQVVRLHLPHPRRALRGQGRELAAAAKDRDVLHAG